MVRIYLCAVFLTGVLNGLEVRGQFTTVINVPPTVIGNDQFIGSDTQLNLLAGGIVGRDFIAGAADGSSTNIEVNIYDGTLGTSFDANSGSVVNVYGGIVRNGFNANSGSQIKILGGNVLLSFNAANGSSVNVSGGRVGDLTALSGSTVILEGGSIGTGFSALSGSHVKLVGNDFRLNGVPVNGLETIGSSVSAELPSDSVLSGTFADGTPFAFWNFSIFGLDTFQAGTLTLESAPLPPIGAVLINIPNDSIPLGIRDGQALVVQPGGIIPHSFTAGPGSRVEVAGGEVGQGFEALGAQVNISAGSIGREFKAFNGTVVNLSGGTINSDFLAVKSEVKISGGLVERRFFADRSSLQMTGGMINSIAEAGDGSIFNISGGHLNGLFAAAGSVVVISGDAMIGDVGVDLGAVVNISNGSIEDLSISRFFVFPATDEKAVVNISGGIIGERAEALDGAVVNFTGGKLGEDFYAWNGSQVNIFGGEVGSRFRAQAGAEINISGGSIGNQFLATGGIVSISGGTFGNLLMDRHSKVNLTGTQFVLDDIDITDLLTAGMPYPIHDRNVTLSGLLVDGSSFSFDLSTAIDVNLDYFSPDALLTVTLVPEPPSIGLLLGLFIGAYLSTCAGKIAFNPHGG